MKRLSVLSTINKLNKFGISPIYQYGLNSTTLRNIITFQQRSYTSSLSSTPPPLSPSPSPSSASPSESPSPSALPSASPSPLPTIAPTFDEKYSYQLISKVSEAIYTQEMEEKKLIVNEIIQSDKLLVSQLTSRLLLQLIDYDISSALKLFDKYHNDLMFHIENKEKMINQEEGKERDEETTWYFHKSQLQPLEIMLEYYVRKQDFDGLEAFCVKYISAYRSYALSKPFFNIVKIFWKTEFEKFTEFVFRLYDINSFVSPKSSIFAMTSLLAVQKDSNESFNRFFNYHIERWGPITSKNASHFLYFLIATNDLKTITNVLNCIDSSITDTTKFKPHVIINLFRVFSKFKKNIPILVEDLILKQMKKLDPKEIAGIIFFYNLIIDNTHYKSGFEINKRLLSRLHDEFLRTIPKETIKLIIDDLVKYFLSANHYEKSLYWFNANSTIFANEISKASIFSFIAYHNLQLDKINIEIKNLTTTTTEKEKENEKKILEIEEYLINKKRIEEYRQFWRKTLKLSENQTFNDKYLCVEESVYSDFKNLNPSEILESIYHLPEGYEEILSQKVDYKLGTLLLDTILKIQSLDKRENQKEDKEQVDEKDEKVNESKDEKKSYISDYWENNDSGFSRLTNKEINFIQPMLEGIKNDLILDRVEFDERYVQMLSIAQQLSLLPQFSKNEIQILRVTLLNLYFYKTEESMVDYLKIVIEMIKNHHTIPFDVFEQTCWLVLELYNKLVNNGSVDITMLVDFIEKFTRENPTFEIGHLIILNSLYSLQKYSRALSHIRSNPNLRNTHDTLLIEIECLLQLDRNTQPEI
ncbi:hypothetical protein ACTFIW_000264 [Dictyostelium discoideum]